MDTWTPRCNLSWQRGSGRGRDPPCPPPLARRRAVVKHQTADDQPTRGPRTRVRSAPQGAGGRAAGRKGEPGQENPTYNMSKAPRESKQRQLLLSTGTRISSRTKSSLPECFLPTSMQAAAENAGHGRHAASLMRHATSQATSWGSGCAGRRPVTAGDAVSCPRPVGEMVTRDHGRWRAWKIRTSSDRRRGSVQPPPQRSYPAATNHSRNGQKGQKDEKDQKDQAGFAHMNRRLPSRLVSASLIKLSLEFAFAPTNISVSLRFSPSSLPLHSPPKLLLSHLHRSHG